MLAVFLLLTVAHINRLDLISIDFVSVFLQTELDVNNWMEFPERIDLLGDERNHCKYILKLNERLYGLKQVSHNWYKKLKQSLIDHGV